jgi:carboxypeptidase family protein
MVRTRRHFERPLLVAIGLAAPAIGTGAQEATRVIDGRVVDTHDRPVSFVNLTVVRGPTAVSDDSGHFRLVVVHKDRIVFEVKRVGYMPTRIALADGGDTTLSVLLLPAIRELPGVEVTDTRLHPPGLAGFEQRMIERKRGAGTGHFFTAKDIEAMQALRVTQVVENAPSMVVRRTGGDRFAIFGRLTSGGECAATVYLDGIRIAGVGDALMGRDRRGRPIVMRSGDGDGVSVDQFVTPTELAGVEVYARAMFAPVQLQPNDPNAMKCAIVAYWTKHGS